MRMKGAENEAAAVEYDNWLLSIGDGTNQLKDDFVALPSEKTEIITSSSLKKAVDWVFDSFEVSFFSLSIFNLCKVWQET